MEIILGISITGEKINRLMGLLTIVSFYENIITKKINIKIASDNYEAFIEIKNIIKVIYKSKETRIEYVKPNNIYRKIAPPLKQNYATYWKFDLFRDLNKNEILFYMDNDSICISKLNINDLLKIFDNGIVKLMGVHSPRPNLERYSVLRLKSPFQYFNAGILIGLKDKSYSVNNISATIKLLRSLDPLDLIWHDQDIFNYLFNEKIYLLDPTYNFSTGYMNKEFRVFNLLNDQFMNVLKNKLKIIHFSGNFILNKKYHPYMDIYYQKLNELKKILIESSIDKKILHENLKQI